MCKLDDRLFTPAVDALAVAAHYEPGSGWSASVAHRHSGEEWCLCAPDDYERLTSDELDQVLAAALGGLLDP